VLFLLLELALSLCGYLSQQPVCIKNKYECPSLLVSDIIDEYYALVGNPQLDFAWSLFVNSASQF